MDLQTHTMTPDPCKVETILKIQPPTTKKQLKSFIGALSFFAPLIPNLQADLAPLHSISGPKAKFILSFECQDSFDKVKKNLATLPVLYLLNSDQVVHAITDAAVGQYVAYTLWQEYNDLDQLVPVKYNSHKLSK